MSNNGKPKFEFLIEIIAERDDDVFHAYCPALKGLHTCGDTEEEAFSNAKDAAVAYLLSLIKHGDPIPIGIIAPKTRTKATSPPTKSYPIHRIENLVVATA